MGADPVACAALAAGADVKAFFVRKDRKAHGLQRWIEGPLLEPGETLPDRRGRGHHRRRRRIQAIERVREAGLGVVRAWSACSTAWPGVRDAIDAAAGAPYTPLSTIDDLYPDRPDR